MRALHLVELQRSRERFEHGLGHAGGIAALEAGVIVDADTGEERDFLTAKPRYTSWPAAVGA